MTLSLFIPLGRGHLRPKESPVWPHLEAVSLFPDTFTQSFGTRPGDGWEGPLLPQTQPHAISLYSRRVLTQARGQINDKQMNLSLPRFHDTWNHRTLWPWVETLSGVQTSSAH